MLVGNFDLFELLDDPPQATTAIDNSVTATAAAKLRRCLDPSLICALLLFALHAGGDRSEMLRPPCHLHLSAAVGQGLVRGRLEVLPERGERVAALQRDDITRNRAQVYDFAYRAVRRV